MNPRDELIRRAMMHIRNGYAVGGKPGEGAMSRAEAERGVSSGTGNVGGVRDGGFGGAGTGSLGGGGGNALAREMTSPVNNAARNDYLRDAARASARLGPNAAQSMVDAGVNSYVANQGARTMANMMGAAPQATVNNASNLNIGDDAFARAMQIISATSPSRTTFPALTGTNVNAGQLEGFELSQPSPVNFNTAVTGYGSGLPIQNPTTISDYMGIKTSAPPVNGPPAQQVNTAAKGDFLGLPVDRLAQAYAGQTSPLASYMGSPTLSKTPSTQMASAPSMPNIGAMKSAEYQAMADNIKGYTPEQTNQLAFGSAYSTRTPNEVGTMIAGLKAAASNPNLSADQKAQLSKDIASLQAMGGIAVSPGSALAPTPQGFTVNPQTGAITKSPGYNVVAGPYASVPSPYGTFNNISFAMPENVALSQRGVAANPNFAQMPAASNTMMAQGPQSILNSNYNTASNEPVDLTGLNANPPLEANRYLRGPQNIVNSNYNVANSGMPVDLTGLNANPPLEAQRYLREPQNIVGSNFNVADSGMPVDLTGLGANPPLEANRYLREPQTLTAYNRFPADATYTAGVAPPVQTAQTTAPSPIVKAPQVSQNITANKLADAFRYRGDRDVDANRERGTTRKLLGLGYTQEQIAAMTPEEIKKVIKDKTPPPTTAPATAPVVTAARGGRMGYFAGGETRDDKRNNGPNNRDNNSETSSSRKKEEDTPYEPISLPPMPEYKPYALPQYTMPSASPLISNFMGSLSQPIPAVQMPQYQSMVSPLQNTQASLANPAMGASGTIGSLGVNPLRYNPMLMNERPDYALTENDSLSNALRLLKG